MRKTLTEEQALILEWCEDPWQLKMGNLRDWAVCIRNEWVDWNNEEGYMLTQAGRTMLEKWKEKQK